MGKPTKAEIDAAVARFLGKGVPTKLTPEQIAYHYARFKAKTYVDKSTVPMSPRQAYETERRLGIKQK